MLFQEMALGCCRSHYDILGGMLAKAGMLATASIAWAKGRLISSMRWPRTLVDGLGLHRIRLLQVRAEVLKLFIWRLPERCPQRIKITRRCSQYAQPKEDKV
jgi:hypothetical protein